MQRNCERNVKQKRYIHSLDYWQIKNLRAITCFYRLSLFQGRGCSCYSEQSVEQREQQEELVLISLNIDRDCTNLK